MANLLADRLHAAALFLALGGIQALNLRIRRAFKNHLFIKQAKSKIYFFGQKSETFFY